MNQHPSKGTRTLVVSYLGVRRAIGVVGLLLPVVLGPVGWFVFGIEIQDNISNYYHTALRDEFVGAICAIGIFLFCYYETRLDSNASRKSRDPARMRQHEYDMRGKYQRAAWNPRLPVAPDPPEPE